MGAPRKATVPHGTFWVAESYHRPVFRDSSGQAYPQVTECFYKLVELMSERLDTSRFTPGALRSAGPVVPDIQRFYPRGTGATLHVASDEVRLVLNELFVSLQTSIDMAFKSGTDRGRALLMQLAEGKITVDAFNKAALAESHG